MQRKVQMRQISTFSAARPEKKPLRAVGSSVAWRREVALARMNSQNVNARMIRLGPKLHDQKVGGISNVNGTADQSPLAIVVQLPLRICVSAIEVRHFLHRVAGHEIRSEHFAVSPAVWRIHTEYFGAGIKGNSNLRGFLLRVVPDSSRIVRSSNVFAGRQPVQRLPFFRRRVCPVNTITLGRFPGGHH